jgi:hypothetical protein
LRCTGATWSDAVVILQGEALALVNIERQAHAIRFKVPGNGTAGPAQPDPGEDDFEAPPVSTPPISNPSDKGARSR